jgi:phosphoglucomutase
MEIDGRAGKPPTGEMLINVAWLQSEYFARPPDPADLRQRVKFGTSGHRGTPRDGPYG